ncbi:hypothetical protein DID74_02550 [Candidatus Marinamargulisbacteria bacterium SCGC AG-333-B06]|nr:hypothetical protein DID74_02550 [Candidatus Marinamargulisbacteria bacterium SCGC AG-333-B06]
MGLKKEDTEPQDLEEVSDTKAKPSFFSMSSPTLDALILKIKTKFKFGSKQPDKDDESGQKSDETRSVVNEEVKGSQDIDEPVTEEEVDLSSGDTEAIHGSEDVAKPVAEDNADSSPESSEATLDDAEDLNDDNIQSQDEGGEGVNIVEDSSTGNQLLDSDDAELHSRDAEDTFENHAQGDSSKQASYDGGTSSTVISGTIFKPNSVLGNLDAKVLKSFSRKKMDSIKKDT